MRQMTVLPGPSFLKSCLKKGEAALSTSLCAGTSASPAPAASSTSVSSAVSSIAAAVARSTAACWAQAWRSGGWGSVILGCGLLTSDCAVPGAK